jgi:hypothetical protein
MLNSTFSKEIPTQLFGANVAPTSPHEMTIQLFLQEMLVQFFLQNSLSKYYGLFFFLKMLVQLQV